MGSPMLHIRSLHIFPVKSLRRYDVASVEVDDLGIRGDRRFLVVDERGQFLTQRALPRMALVSTALSHGTLTLSAEGAGSISVPASSEPSAKSREVTVWRQSGLLAEDCGDDAAAWLADFLQQPCRLVRIGESFHRPVPKDAARKGDVTSFVDAAPVLVANTASLEELNRRIAASGGDPVPMNRFRANIVIEGAPAFAEEAWATLRTASVVFRSAGKSERCIVTTTDQLTGERGAEPLRTLAAFHRVPPSTAVCFGLNLINETKSGRLSVGDELIAE